MEAGLGLVGRGLLEGGVDDTSFSGVGTVELGSLECR